MFKHGDVSALKHGKRKMYINVCLTNLFVQTVKTVIQTWESLSDVIYKQAFQTIYNNNN